MISLCLRLILFYVNYFSCCTAEIIASRNIHGSNICIWLKVFYICCCCFSFFLLLQTTTTIRKVILKKVLPRSQKTMNYFSFFLFHFILNNLVSIHTLFLFKTLFSLNCADVYVHIYSYYFLLLLFFLQTQLLRFFFISLTSSSVVKEN